MKTNSNLESVEVKNMRKILIFIFIVVVIILILVITNNSSDKNTYNDANDNYQNSSINSNNSSTSSSDSNNKNNTDTVINKNKVYGFDETFFFDNLEITIGSNYSFTVVQNQFSDYNNHEVLKLPVTVKNISSDTHGLNMFYYKCYGSNGTELKGLGAYFDEDINYAGDLRSGASYTKYMYFAYDGGGLYALEFDNYATKVTVEFQIKKG